MATATAIRQRARATGVTPRPRRTKAPAGKPAAVLERNCSIARTASILSDAWAFLVIREGFFGARRFETFRAALGLPRGTLSERLRALTAQRIFTRVRYSDAPNRVEYRLTPAGLDFYPPFMALMQFGDRWLAGGKPPPLLLVHADCGQECMPLVACSACRERVDAEAVVWRDGPGAGRETLPATRRPRRASDPSQFMRGRPSSVSRSLQVIGDRWSCLIIREAFLGLSRFDKLQAELGIAPNILTDRLGRLIDLGVLERLKYQDQPERFEYRLTEMGRDLFGSLLMMMSWGDRHRAERRPPQLLSHRSCGQDFTPVVICDKCGGPVVAQNMRYKLRYKPQDYAIDSETGHHEPGRI